MEHARYYAFEEFDPRARMLRLGRGVFRTKYNDDASGAGISSTEKVPRLPRHSTLGED